MGNSSERSYYFPFFLRDRHLTQPANGYTDSRMPHHFNTTPAVRSAITNRMTKLAGERSQVIQLSLSPSFCRSLTSLTSSRPIVCTSIAC